MLRFSERVNLFEAQEVDLFLDFYRACKADQFAFPPNEMFDPNKLAARVRRKEAKIYFYRERDLELKAALIVECLSFPATLGESYFGVDFEDFWYIHSFCCTDAKVVQALIYSVFWDAEKFGNGMVLAHVMAEHRPFCDLVLPPEKFKRAVGSNLEIDDALFCVDLRG